MGRLALKFLAGALAGLLAWLLIEPTRPLPNTPEWTRFELTLTLTLGIFVGLAVGALDGWFQGSRTHLLRGAGLGALLGAIAAPAGLALGGLIAGLVFGGVNNPIARVMALTPLGALLGVGIGASSLNLTRMKQGLVGGAIGAGLGAAVFDVVGSMMAMSELAAQGISAGGTGEVGTLPRAIYCVSLGAGIGLFIGLVELVSKSAWLRLTLGRNEGKEWVIDRPQTFIGRSEGAHVPLFGDAAIAPMHACIVRQGPQYVLMDSGSPSGTYLNGQRITEAVLMPGSVIQVGSVRLEFLTKNQPAPARAPEQYAGAAYPLGYQTAPAGVPFPVPIPPTPAPAPAPAPAPVPQPAAPFYWALVVADGPLGGRSFPVQSAVEIGREGGLVPLSYDSSASRRHARIEPAAGGLQVTDLGSTNGTFVNGQKVPSALLRPGDVLKIGATSFHVQSA